MTRTVGPFFRVTIFLISCSLLGEGLAGCASPSIERSLMRDLAVFRAAQSARDTEILSSSVNDFGYSAHAKKELVESYIDYLEETGADRRQSAMRVERVDWFKDGPKLIAFLRLRAVSKDSMPIPTPNLTDGDLSTLLAFSLDGGKSWKFNVQDCISQRELERFSPNYFGKPPLLP